MWEALLDRAMRAVDEAVIWQLGFMTLSLPTTSEYESVDISDFWDSSIVHDPAPVTTVRDVGRTGCGRVRVVDLEGPSQGPGGHPGSKKFIARAHLQTEIDDAPTLLMLHGFAIPVAWYEEVQCR